MRPRLDQPPLGDVLRDGRVDANDYRLIALDQGRTGPVDTDIASPKGLGLPDGTVVAWDLHCLYELLAAVEKAKVTPPTLPVLTEGFESGGLGAMNWSSRQWSKWFVTSDDRRSGLYSVRAGAIAARRDHDALVDRQLHGRPDLLLAKGLHGVQIWDNFRFYIDSKLQEKLSGEVPWSEASFPVEAGTQPSAGSMKRTTPGLPAGHRLPRRPDHPGGPVDAGPADPMQRARPLAETGP